MLANNVCKSIIPYYGNNSMVILEILLGNIFSMKNINPHILVQIPLTQKKQPTLWWTAFLAMGYEKDIFAVL